MKKLDLFLLATGIAAFIIYFIFFIDVQSVSRTLSSANQPIVVTILFLSVLDVACFAFAFKTLIEMASSRLTFKKAWKYVWCSTFIDIIIPGETVSGEISRIYFLSRYENIPSYKTTNSVLWQRAIGMVTTSIMFTFSSLFLIFGPFAYFVWFMTCCSWAFSALVCLYCVKPAWIAKTTQPIVAILIRLKRQSLATSLSDYANKLATSMPHQSRGKLSLAITMQSISWACALVLEYLSFVALGYTPSMQVILFVHSFLLAVKLPIGPSMEFGISDLTMVGLFSFFLVPTVLAIAATIIIRFATLWFRLVIGFAAYTMLGKGKPVDFSFDKL